MFAKSIVSAGLALAIVFSPAWIEPASARVSVNVNVGKNISTRHGNIRIGATLGTGNQSISCAEGERLLRNRGFHNISRVDCRGRYFTYRGTRGNHRYEISVDSRTSRVVDYRRLHRV